MRRRKGFVLISAAASMIGLLVVVGLAVDGGRLYVARSELQVFADETAVAAAFELDGTPEGLGRARTVAASGPGSGDSPNRWNFATQVVTPAPPQFSATPFGTYVSEPGSPAGLRFIKVQVTGYINLYFLPLVPGIGGSQSATVTAVAGQTPQNSLGNGLAPFSPVAHDTADPNFGFAAGTLYTLRWASNVNEFKLKVQGISTTGDMSRDQMAKTIIGAPEVTRFGS